MTQSSTLDPARLELVRRRMAAAGMGSRTGQLPVGDPAQVSFGQQRLWFLDQMAPGTTAYVVPAAVRIRGPVAPAILRAALRGVVARHGVLRASYVAGPQGPVQVVHPPGEVELAVLRADELGPDPLAGATAAAQRLAGEPFDLATGPLLRAELYCLAEDDHVLAMVVHHIACDGASAAILVREVCSACLAIAAGDHSQPAPLVRQYWSYAQLQADQLAAGAWDEQLAHWRRVLAGLPPRLALPQDKGAAGAGPAHRMTRRLDAQLLAALERQATGAEATTFMVLLAAWQAQLSRRTGQSRVPVATPVNTRGHVEYESLIGFFVNTVVVVGDCGGDPSFAELLGRTRSATVAALGNADVPFEVLVHEVNPPRDLAGEPIAQVLFSYQPEPPFQVPGGPVAFEVLSVGAPVAKYSLTLYLAAAEDGLVATLEYDSARWLAGSAAGLLTSYEALLRAVVADPGIRVSRLDPPAVPVLCGPVATATPVLAALADWAQRRGDATAVVDDSGTLSYRDLMAAAAGLADVLRSLGAGPERPVLVAVPRSRHTVVATLAAMLAGAPFVPLDASLPPARVTAVVAGSRAGIVVVAGEEPTQGWSGLAVVDLREVPPATSSWAAPGPGAELAYLMFTSGSTGVPKAVAVRMQALSALVAAVADLVGAGPDDVTLGLTTTTFDISVLELLLPLATGGCLRIVGDQVRTDPAAIATAIAAGGVTIAQATPTAWRALLADGWRPPRPMRLLCGGEALDPALASALMATGATAWNVYGPTETTIWSMAGRLAAQPDLGQPLAGQRVMILDAAGVPVPDGTPGELCVGGIGLARGYWGDPAATAARFVPDPFLPGQRIYRTGDLVRRCADGALRFLGRSDDQVKIRGHRVEPGEVEAELAALPGVRECAVVAAAGALAAFVVGAPDADAELPRHLRSGLAQRLPAHLVPSRIEVVAELPRNSAGKLDRVGLRVQAGTPARGGAVAAGTQQVVAKVWAELLGAAPGPEDDFFALGGHSLLATTLARQIAEATGAPIRVRHVFERPTVAGLAALVAELGVAQPGPATSGLSPAQQRLVFLSRLEPTSTAYHVTMAAAVAEPLDPARIQRALHRLSAAHPALRTTIAEDGLVGRVDPTGRIVVRVVAAPDTAVLDATTVAELARPELLTPFDLGAGPLVRVVLVTSRAAGSALVLVAHHVIADGWSARLLVNQLYEAYRTDQPIHLAPAPPAPAAITAGDLERAAARLDGWPRVLALPPEPTLAGDSQDATQAPAAGREVVDLAGIGDLAALCRAARVTPYPVLFAAWVVAVARLADQPRLLVGVPFAGRDRPGAAEVVGLLANTLVVGADTGGDPTFTDLVNRIAGQVRAALLAADVPFDQLVAAMDVDRDLSRTPLFQVMFSYESDGTGAAIPGIRPLRLPGGAAKTTLGLWLADGPQGLRGELEFDRGRVSQQVAQALADEFVAVLAGGIAQPAARVGDLGVQVAAAPPVPGDDGPADVLAILARAPRPDAPAVIDGDHELSYQQLLHAAGQVAAALVGVTPEEPVGVLVEPDLATYVTILGVLAAGAAYLPLDPLTPPSWRDDICARAGVRRVLDPHELAGPVGPLRATAAAGHHSGPLSGGSAAYIMHTSGSSGRPKGVVVSHGSLARFATAAAARYGLAPTDRVLQLATLAFDASLEELFATWAAGAAVVPAPAAFRGTTVELLAHADTAGVTVLDLPTGLWHELVADLAAGRLRLPARVRLAVIGGEAADPGRVAQFRAHAPAVELIDTYGPTEATVVAASGHLRAPAEAGLVGRPLPGVSLAVRGWDGRRVGPGQVGELVIGGAGVARGYLHDPRQTATRFRPDPAGLPGSRAYWTGDLVRREPDGKLRYLGRRDRELKVRGFRVDPGVVERALLAQPAVGAAAVTAVTDLLVAAVVLRPDAPAADADAGARLRHDLLGVLPEHLVPGVVLVLPALPLTDRGKVDRVAIAGFVAARTAAPDTGDDPAVAEMMAAWAGVLEVQVGPDSDFFGELAGHSLLALRLTRAVADRLGRDVPVRAVFEAPTPARLVRWLRVNGTARSLPPILVREDGLPAPLSPAAARILGMQAKQPTSSQFTMVASGQLEQALDPAVLAQAWYVLSARHEALRWRITEGQEPEVRIDPSPQPITVHDLRAFPEERAAAAVVDLVASARRRAFDLAAEPPFELAHLRMPTAGDVLVLTAHHIGCDEASTAIVFAELSAIYRTIAHDVPLGLPPRGPGAGDLATWERSALANGLLDADRKYWRARLAGPLAPLRLTGMVDAEARVLDQVSSLQLGAGQLRALADLAAQSQATTYTAVMALVMRAVAELAGQRDARVATMAANRSLPDRAGMVGLLANTIVARAEVDPGRSLAEDLAGVRAAVLEALDHQHIPFEVVLADLALAEPQDLAPVLMLWSRVEPGGRTAAARVAPVGLSGFQLVLDVVVTGSDLELSVVHEAAAEPTALALLDRIRGEVDRLPREAS